MVVLRTVILAMTPARRFLTASNAALALARSSSTVPEKRSTLGARFKSWHGRQRAQTGLGRLGAVLYLGQLRVHLARLEDIFFG
jgi:hypothetical protein